MSNIDDYFFFFSQNWFLMFERLLFDGNDLYALFEKKDEKKFFLSENVLISSVVIDSREATKSSLFIAIKGEKNDGHFYMKSAVENGAVFIVCEYLSEDIREFLVKKKHWLCDC